MTRTKPTIFLASSAPTTRFVGRCKDCVRPMAVSGMVGGSDYRTATCAECGGPVPLERIYGVVNHMTCNPSCEGAVGSLCECACGGANHSAAYEQVGEALASAVRRYRERFARRQGAAQKVRDAKRAAAAAAADAVRERRAAAAAAWSAGHQAEAAWLSSTAELPTFEGAMASEMLAQLDRFGSLLPEQLDSIRVRIGNAAVPPPPPPPEGETVVEGEIVSIKFEPNRFSHSGARVPKMLVSTGAIRVWSTVPASVLRSAHRGDRVRFVADLKRSNRDDRFFFANRPRKAVLVAA